MTVAIICLRLEWVMAGRAISLDQRASIAR
jgi:hypothetical protein